ncbi:trypsin-like serine protease [Corynebacterium silvaticum]|nr:trypsin-like serine protease [Corynebacterium silvaticum]NOM65609.1 trypsin-like serine protease [Corynebacterium silvaticum]NON70441.1 trypsin-like serine protease [Corynebacterium silvaticum]TFA92142.1 trypsin-like serine protease [Corynebacterium silvaticum]TFA94949.1 trypsin-like serine protease [Corynebacterium silvaticum]
MLIRKIAALCTAGITALACLVAPAQAMDGGAEVSSDYQLAQMVIRVQSCTGTAIAPHWVLTAKHCFRDETGKRYVHLGIKRATEENKTVIDRFVEADKTFFIPNSDVALLHTIQDMKLPRYAELDYSPLTPGTQGTGYGWGRGTAGLLKRGELAVKSIGKTTHRGPAIEAYHTDGSNTQAGDSGGPLFVNSKVVGVASHKAVSYQVPWVNYSQLYGLENEITQIKNTAVGSETDQGPREQQWNESTREMEDVDPSESPEFLADAEETTEQSSVPEIREEDLLNAEAEIEKPETELTVPAPTDRSIDAGEGHTPPRQETKGIAGIILGVLAGLGGFGALIAFLINYMKGLI